MALFIFSQILKLGKIVNGQNVNIGNNVKIVLVNQNNVSVYMLELEDYVLWPINGLY